MAGAAPLPIDDVLAALRSALSAHSSAVLVESLGAGKTTRAPLALLDEPWAKGKRLILLEPRRIAARAAAAARMAATHFGAPPLRQHRRHARLRLRHRPSIRRSLPDALEVA
jgi:HrpA-like RNA helicase